MFLLKMLNNFCSLCTDAPQKDGDDAASDSASDSASSLFTHWGHDLGPESRRVALKKFRYYGYNGYLSDRISLTRPIPDLRPDGSVIRWFCAFWGGFSDSCMWFRRLQMHKYIFLLLSVQMQKHVLLIRPSAAQRNLHLCQRGPVSVAALRPHSHPKDSSPPPQRDHTGGRPQQQL